MQRKSQRAVLLSLIPIALGHAASIAIVIAMFLSGGVLIDHALLKFLTAGALIAGAAWHLSRGHAQRPLIGMQTGFFGLGIWSFLMATTHGAGLMLVPALFPLCMSGAAKPAETLDLAFAAVALHTTVMLTTIAVISILVHKWIGLGFLRKGWVNLDLIWTGALLACGLVILIF